MSAFSRYVEEERFEKAPRLPTGRPPTKREVWERWHAIYYDRKGHRRTPSCHEACNHRNPGELEAFCRDGWVWGYVCMFIYSKWNKQPGWVEGDPVIPEAVPKEPFQSGASHTWLPIIERCVKTAERLMPERSEQQLDMKEAA